MTLKQIEQAGGIYPNGIIDISVSIEEFYKQREKADGLDDIHFKEQQTANSNSSSDLRDKLIS